MDSVFAKANKIHKDIVKIQEDGEKRDKKYAEIEAVHTDMKKEIDRLAKLRDQILKRKHTHRVYKPKKK